jgi:prephenate dehydrogenase
MRVKIALVGLGKIGASVGLALAEHSDRLQRVGIDREPLTSRQARRLGAVDKMAFNLPRSVREADVVFLALPLDQVRETLEVIAPELKEGAVVMDTSPVKQQVAAWAQELLPEGRFYVGLTPILNPVYLHDRETGVDAAHKDLFSGGMMGIASPPGTDSAAIKLAADLCALLGATPLFVDMAEVDGLTAFSHLLPQLVSAGVVLATTTQPGWNDGRKFAGVPHAHLGSAVVSGDPPEALGEAALLNSENVTRALEAVISVLSAFQEQIRQQDGEGLKSLLNEAREARQLWWRQRELGDWEAAGEREERPSVAGEMFRWMFLGRRGSSRGGQD